MRLDVLSFATDHPAPLAEPLAATNGAMAAAMPSQDLSLH